MELFDLLESCVAESKKNEFSTDEETEGSAIGLYQNDKTWSDRVIRKNRRPAIFSKITK